MTDAEGVWRFSWRDVLLDCMLGGTEREQSRETFGFPSWAARVIVSCVYPIGRSEVRGQVEGRTFYFGHIQLEVPMRNLTGGVESLVCPGL